MVAGTSLGGGFVHRLAPAVRDDLAATGRLRRYQRGAAIFLEGDEGDFVVVIIEGRTKAVASTVDGDETLLGLRGPGDLVGELATVDEAAVRRSASVIALEPVVCRIVRRDEFLGFLERHPSAAIEVLRMVAGKLRDADRRRVEFGAYDTTRRLAHLLIDLAEHHAGEGPYIGTGLSQQELAGLIGSSRESVARALNVLRHHGLVATGRRSVTVLDLDRLRAYAG